MSIKKKNLPVSCSECRALLPAQAETCTECGYPGAGATVSVHESDSSQDAQFEYKLIQILGAIAVVAGVVAAMVDSPIAATVAIALGTGTYLAGLLGSWWNSGD